MQIIRLSETTAALIEIPFTTVSISNLQTRLKSTDLANGSITVKIKKGGVTTAASGAGTFTACDDTNAPGVRGYQPATADLVIGVSTFIFADAGAVMEPREVPVMVVNDDPYRPDYYGTAVTGTLTTTTFTSDRTETDDNHWTTYSLVEWLTGANAGGVYKLSSYTGSTKLFTVATAMPNAPLNGDKFRIITR